MSCIIDVMNDFADSGFVNSLTGLILLYAREQEAEHVEKRRKYSCIEEWWRRGRKKGEEEEKSKMAAVVRENRSHSPSRRRCVGKW